MFGGMDRIDAMRIFVATLDEGSLAGAGRLLRRSPAAISRAISFLEAHVGVELLHRTTRRIRLSEAGERYAAACRRILTELDEAEMLAAGERSAPRGLLTLSAPPISGEDILRPIVDEFLDAFPRVQARLLLLDRTVNLVEEGVDVAVRIGRLRDSSVVAIPVGQVRRVVCATPEYLRRSGTPRTPQEVHAHACIRHTGLAPRADWQFRIGRRSVSVPLNAVVSCNDIDSSLEACLGGHGLGQFLSYQTAPYRNQKRLRYILEEFETEPVPVQVVYAQSRLVTGKVRAFVDDCVAALRRVPFD